MIEDVLPKKFLEKKDLDKVHPKIRPRVEAALENGENVPYGVTYLDFRPLTEEEIKWAKELCERHGW